MDICIQALKALIKQHKSKNQWLTCLQLRDLGYALRSIDSRLGICKALLQSLKPGKGAEANWTLGFHVSYSCCDNIPWNPAAPPRNTTASYSRARAMVPRLMCHRRPVQWCCWAVDAVCTMATGWQSHNISSLQNFHIRYFQWRAIHVPLAQRDLKWSKVLCILRALSTESRDLPSSLATAKDLSLSRHVETCSIWGCGMARTLRMCLCKKLLQPQKYQLLGLTWLTTSESPELRVPLEVQV